MSVLRTAEIKSMELSAHLEGGRVAKAQAKKKCEGKSGVILLRRCIGM